MKKLLLIAGLLMGLSATAQEQLRREKSEMSPKEIAAARKGWFEEFAARFEAATYRHKGLEMPYRTLRIAPEKGGCEALVIYLHSSKGRGIDNRTQLHGTVQTVVKNLEQTGEKILLAVPQCRPDRRWNENYATLGDKMPIVLKGLIDRLLVENSNIDPSRIYIMGDSSGGAGVLYMLSDYPKLFAGAIAASCYPHKSNSAAATAKTPLVISYGDMQPDKQQLTKEFADKVAKKGGTVRYIPLKGYDDTHSRLSPELLTWMLAFRR